MLYIFCYDNDIMGEFNTFLLRIPFELKEKLQRRAGLERRSITSLILFILDKKLGEADNAKPN